MKSIRHASSLWTSAALTVFVAVVAVVVLTPPVPGSAQGQSTLMAAAIDPTKLEKIPKVPPAKDAGGKTLQQKCQESGQVPKALWGVCCVPKDYLQNEACLEAMKGKKKETAPPAETGGGGGQGPLTPAELKLLPVAWQKEYAQILKQIQQFQKDADQAQQEITTMANCELACPGGAGRIQCTQETVDTCIAHDKCITACDKGYPALKNKINKLEKTRKALEKKTAAFEKKVEAYKKKNARKFRAIEGASH